MARRYGRSPRGERLDCPIPHGHWKSTTFLAGLTGSGFIAPYVLDGAMTGELFLAWTEQMPGLFGSMTWVRRRRAGDRG